MKLELKHLAPYLPFELMVNTEYGGERNMSGLDDETIFVYGDENGEQVSIDYDTCKPILRPLSDLTKDDILGEFYMAFGAGFRDFKIYKYNCLDNLRYSTPNTQVYEVVEKMLEMHFDVFGLIEAGLAIDINKIKS